MIDHLVSFHRNRSLWEVVTNMAFLIQNHVNNHHVFFHRNQSLWAVVTNLALLIFTEVLYYHMIRGFPQRSHKPYRTRLYLKVGRRTDSPDIPLACHNEDPTSVFCAKYYSILKISFAKYCSILKISKPTLCTST